MIGKAAFVLASIVFVILIGMWTKTMIDFTIQRLVSNDSVSSYWVFWLLVIGPMIIGVSAMVVGILEWIDPKYVPDVDRQKPIDSWIIPR